MSSTLCDVALRDPLPFRPKPSLDDDNRFFWTSGADGRLRFLHCGVCSFWIHPPAPRCPRCLSTTPKPDAVRGRGLIHSFTVNHHGWHPDAQPYVIALVELDEQPGLRLTTNLVVDDPTSVCIGGRVEVCFLEHDGVWYPLFTPVAP